MCALCEALESLQDGRGPSASTEAAERHRGCLGCHHIRSSEWYPFPRGAIRGLARRSAGETDVEVATEPRRRCPRGRGSSARLPAPRRIDPETLARGTPPRALAVPKSFLRVFTLGTITRGGVFAREAASPGGIDLGKRGSTTARSGQAAGPRRGSPIPRSGKSPRWISPQSGRCDG